MDDNIIVNLYFERNELAISKTSEKYGNYCYYIAYNILSDNCESEECVNDTYLKAWNCIPPKRPKILKTFLGKFIKYYLFCTEKNSKALFLSLFLSILFAFVILTFLSSYIIIKR